MQAMLFQRFQGMGDDMIFIDGEFHSTDFIIGPWITDREIEAIARLSRLPNITPQGLADLRTACRESLAQADHNFRNPFTIQAKTSALGGLEVGNRLLLKFQEEQ
jgi:hypothetical protein